MTGGVSPNSRVAIVLTSAIVHRLAAGIQSYAAGKRDYWVIDIYRPKSELRRLLRKWKPVGIITQWFPDISPAIVELGFPTVLTAYDGNVPGVGRADVDDIGVGLEAARHLLETGLRNFGFFGNDLHYSDQRLSGFRAGLREQKLTCASFLREPKVRRELIEYWHDRDPRLESWVASLPKPVGILAAHDPLGRQLAEACRNVGLRIPEEVAIVAVDNDEIVCGLTFPALSSVQIPWLKVGFETARMMEEILASGKVPAKPLLISPGSVTTRRSSDLLAVAQPQLQQALRLIRDQACNGLNVKELTNALSMSRRKLEQEFQRHLRRTPRDEIMRVRLDAARNLLSRTDLSMPFLAERCGFGSAERFSVVFRQVEGIPPTRYRERYRLRSEKFP